ncbi:MAG: glycosyltransferase [bacterium]
MISLIIPIFHEEARLEALLAHLHNLGTKGEYEIIIVDGDPQRTIIKRIRQRRGLVMITSEKGRGRQMNAGARHAKGDILLFLHADTLLPFGALEKVTFIMQKNIYIWGVHLIWVWIPQTY